MNADKSSTVLELQEIDSSIVGMKQLLDNTPLNLDQLHDSTQTFLEGLRGRLFRVINDVEAMDAAGSALVEANKQLALVKRDFTHHVDFYKTVLKEVKKQEGKRGRHEKLAEITKRVEAELKEAEEKANGAEVAGQLDE